MRLADELQFSVYNFEDADVGLATDHFNQYAEECKSLLNRFDTNKKALDHLKASLDHRARELGRFPVIPAYDLCLKCSHLFNILDARGAISVTERVGVIARVRALAVGIAKAWVDQQKGDLHKNAGAASSETPDEPEPVRERKAKKEKLATVG